MVIGKFHSHGRGSGSQAPVLLGTCIVRSGQSRGPGQAPAKGKMNVLVWFAVESQGHGELC